MYENECYDYIFKFKTQVGKHGYRYRLSEDSPWLTKRKFVDAITKLGYTEQQWYNEKWLKIAKDDCLKCQVCGKPLWFGGIGCGYRGKEVCGISCSNIRMWQQPGYRERLKESTKRGAAKRKLAPNYHENIMKAVKASSTPEAIQRMKASLRDYNDNRGGREKARQSAIKRWQRPEEHEKQCQAQQKRLLEKPETHFVPETWNSKYSTIKTTKCTNAKSDGAIRVRSNLERDFVEIVLEHLDCTYAYESITVPWFDESDKQHAYFIDFVVHFNNAVYLIEVKPWRFRHDIDNLAKSKAAQLYASEHDMLYVMIHENECRDIETFITYLKTHTQK